MRCEQAEEVGVSKDSSYGGFERPLGSVPDAHSKRLPYAKPRLRHYGSVSDLTAAGSPDKQEQTNPKMLKNLMSMP
jgi:hypothetical protein